MEGEFISTEGGPLPFLGFEPNQPDNFNDDEDCLELRGTGANDIRCNAVRPAWCSSVDE